MNNNAALTPGVGTDVPATACALACARQTLPKERRGNRKTRGQERRIKDAGLHSSEQAAFHGTCLSGWFKVRRYLLLVHKRPCAPTSAGRAGEQRLSDSLFPFSSSHQILSKRCKISTVKVDCYTGSRRLQNSLSGPARIQASSFPKPRSCCGDASSASNC